MESFTKQNLRNIQARFREKTGVDLGQSPVRPWGRTLAAAVVAVCCLVVSAFGVSRFSPLAGDDLALGAVYRGNGVVEVQVENRSDKVLEFQPRLRLMRWSTGEEVLPLSGEVTFSRTRFDPWAKGIIEVDLSGAYSVEALEEPLTDDHYYLVLTNDNFVFGQDWVCPVEFAEPILTPPKPVDPIPPSQAEPRLTAEILEELKPYFEGYTADPFRRREEAEEYLALCQKLLDREEGNLVPPVYPKELTVGEPEEPVIFDPGIPADQQLSLTGLHFTTMDGYGKMIGGAKGEGALELSALLPQRKGETGGAPVPLFYLFTYEKDGVQGPEVLAFVRGRLLTFAQLEPYKVYEDEQYLCYEVSELFYSGLRGHVESMVSQRSDIYFDEPVWERVQSIHSYYKENLGDLILRRS